MGGRWGGRWREKKDALMSPLRLMYVNTGSKRVRKVVNLFTNLSICYFNSDKSFCVPWQSNKPIVVCLLRLAPWWWIISLVSTCTCGDFVLPFSFPHLPWLLVYFTLVLLPIHFLLPLSLLPPLFSLLSLPSLLPPPSSSLLPPSLLPPPSLLLYLLPPYSIFPPVLPAAELCSRC